MVVYGPTPPDGVITTEPVAKPLHNTLVIAVVAVMAVGSVMVTGTKRVQLFASVTVKVYEPAARPACDGMIVYGPTPPDGVIATEPVASPLHNTLVTAVVAVMAVGSVMVTGTKSVQLLASVTVKV